jgi:hypothetical protein
MRERLPWPSMVRVSIAGLVLYSLLPSIAAAEEPTIDQIEYHPAELPPPGARTRALVVGAALTVGWYGAAVGTSFLWPDAENAKDLRLPVVGPWLALGDTGCAASESRCTTVTVIARTAFAVVSGVGQAGGLFAIAEGIFMDTGSGAAAGRARAPERSWTAAPMMLPDGGGLEVVGRF